MPTYDIRDFGAHSQALPLVTRCIQAAIEAAAAAGGGRVVVPPGTWRSGTLRLCSHLVFELSPGAVLLGSPDLGDYQRQEWGHHGDITPWHLLLVAGCENVLITGRGAIDGNGPSFWHPDRRHDWDFWREIRQRVSPMVEITNCRQVRVEQVTLRNSAGWTLHLHDSDRCAVHGVCIRNSFFGPNTDGIDVTGCHDLVISDCDIMTGDDAIALKTTECSRSCERIAITNCLLQTSCVGVRIGFESREDFRHIAISNLVIPRCSRVFDLRSLEGSVIEHVTISNIVASTNSGWPVNRPIELVVASLPNLFSEGLPADHPFHGKDRPLLRQGAIRHIAIRSCDITTDGRITCVAAEGHELRDVAITDLNLHYQLLDDPSPFGQVEMPAYLPTDSLAAPRTAKAAIVAMNVHDLRLERWRIDWPVYPIPDPDGWFLLRSPQKEINPLIPGHEDQIISGEQRPCFKALWGRNLHGGMLDSRELADSEGGAPFDLQHSTCRILQ